jgi:hypothetical protein
MITIHHFPSDPSLAVGDLAHPSALLQRTEELALSGEDHTIYTFSEFPQTRACRLVREGKLRPEDVRIVVMDEGIEHTLRLDADGEYIDIWPGQYWSDLSFNDLFA